MLVASGCGPEVIESTLPLASTGNVHSCYRDDASSTHIPEGGSYTSIRGAFPVWPILRFIIDPVAYTEAY
jgi:hypothetical protein